MNNFDMTRICLIGPTYPFRGGIAHYTTLLARYLREEAAHETLLVSFSRQYPSRLYKGKSDRDPSGKPLKAAAHYWLDTLNPLTWWRAARKIVAWQPELVVIQWWHPFFTPIWSVLGRLLKRWLPQMRLIFLCHNVLPHEASVVDKTAVSLALSPADAFIVHAESERAQLEKLLPNRAVSVVHLPTYGALGEEIAHSELAEGVVLLLANLPTDRPLLLFCGFVRPYKGLDVLLKAMPQVLAQRTVHLAVVGEFWEQEGYAELIAALGDDVTLMADYVPDELLAAFMRKADVVVLPYRSATQSAILQMAFGHGVPVITTNVGGLPEVVTDGVTGLIVPPENPNALAVAIERFFAEEMGARMREQILGESGRFSWQHIVDAIVS